MPQATFELCERWVDDCTAFNQLKGNFVVTRGGVIHPKRNYTPTDDDLSAIDYLFQEWDYGYSNLPPTEK